MDIKIKWPWELNDLTNQVVVICDVYAATTNIAYFLTHGVQKLLIVNKENVVQAKERFPQALVIGDRPKELSARLFDSGNSSHLLSQLDVSGKVVLYMTSNGSRIIEYAIKKGAGRILTVSLTTLSSVASYVEKYPVDRLTLVPAGEIDNHLIPDLKAQEDLICAQLLKDRLVSKNINLSHKIQEAKEFIRAHYRSTHMEGNFKEVFVIDKYNCVPTYHQVYENFIEMTDTFSKK